MPVHSQEWVTICGSQPLYVKESHQITAHCKVALEFVLLVDNNT